MNIITVVTLVTILASCNAAAAPANSNTAKDPNAIMAEAAPGLKVNAPLGAVIRGVLRAGYDPMAVEKTMIEKGHDPATVKMAVSIFHEQQRLK